VRVRVLRAGVCGTDLALVDALYPFEGVPGHEFVGVVEEVPEFLQGRRVVGEINAACGHCPECLAGLAKHCRARTALGIRGRDGAFAEYLQLPAANLHPVPDGVSTDAAVFTEPLAAALDIVERLAPNPGERVLVVGVGRLGQLVCRALSASGTPVVALGRNPDKLARLEGIVAETLEAEDVEPRSFAMAVECTGDPSGLPIALGALRAQGTLVLKKHLPGTLDARYDASGGRRAAPGGLPLRPLRGGLAPAGRAEGRGGVAHRRALSPQRRCRGLRS